MRSTKVKKAHLILALRNQFRIDLLLQFKQQVIHLYTKETTDEANRTICENEEKKGEEWVIGGKNSDDEGFIKSIRIVYK